MYERFFGLTDTPFRLTPDPRYLFMSRRHADALAHLKLGVTESSGFVCITGDVGTGKTTLLRHFLAQLGPEVGTAYIFNPALTAVELLQTINAEFGLASEETSRAALVKTLNAHLVAQHQAGRRSMVLIDEAQALDLEVLEQLRLLSNLETTTEKLLRIILVGQPQLRAVLLHPDLLQLNQRMTLRWHIGPLARRETMAYVRHRLAVAGSETGRTVFTRLALGRLHHHAGGVPRLVNMIAHRALLAAYAKDRPRVGVRDVHNAVRELSSVPLPAAPPRRRLWRAVTAVAAGAGVGTIMLAVGSYLAEPPAPLARAPEPAAVTAPPPTIVASAPPPTLPPTDPAVLIEALAPDESVQRALPVIFDAWHVPPFVSTQEMVGQSFAAVAAAHDLEHVALKSNMSMLRLLDVPALLELHFPRGAGQRFVALVGMGDNGYELAGLAEPTIIDDAFLSRFWYGQAHVFWQDTEQLGPDALTPGTSGARVRRLQVLLIAAGSYDGPISGTFGQETDAAVRRFQRSHFLEPDGVVGPLTRLSLHTAASRSARPSLAGAEEIS